MLDAHIVKRRRQFTVEATLRVAAGESVAIFGPSGAGKSTLLSCIAGLEQPDAGHIRWNGTTLYPSTLALHQRGLGYLTQLPALFPHLSVAENVRFGLIGTQSASEQETWLLELSQHFGLTELWHAQATKISGGQAQRVALARMLARRPPLVLLDEPFAGLDRGVVRELIGILAGWQAEHRCAMIVVDHQENVLRRLCSRAYVLDGGRVIQQAEWDELERVPASAAVAALLAPL